MVYKFEEVLNDLMDYFILGDPDYLLHYKNAHGLPDDLLLEFTTQESGDLAVSEGVMLPLSKVENLPYTVYFNLSEGQPELLKEGNELQVRQAGHCLRVESGAVYLYTMPYLRSYTDATVARIKQHRSATISLPNGWYAVEVLGGLTKQTTELINVNGDRVSFEELEPTFEFLIIPSKDRPEYTADLNYPYQINS